MEKINRIYINILGQVCPSCLLVTLEEINTNRKQLRCGEAEIVVRTDHRDATRTIPQSVKAMGYNVDVKKTATYYEIRIHRKL